MENKTAFIFPAFITEFTGKEIDFLRNNGLNPTKYLKIISETINIDFPDFTYKNDLFREELTSQLLAYTFSCTYYDVLKQKSIIPDFVAGYSMGVYASLYSSKSIKFETGAKLIFDAYHLLYELTKTGLYGMGAIIGLPYLDVQELIQTSSLSVEIINVNNEHSLVVAGLKKEINILLEKSKEEGALTAAELTVDTPYHSKYLSRFAIPFKTVLNKLEFDDPQVPIVSTYNQRLIFSAEDIKQELVFNLTEKISWHKTMQKLVELGVNDMYECGAGKDLKKISRFIKGDYKLRSAYKI